MQNESERNEHSLFNNFFMFLFKTIKYQIVKEEKKITGENICDIRYAYKCKYDCKIILLPLIVSGIDSRKLY